MKGVPHLERKLPKHQTGGSHPGRLDSHPGQTPAPLWSQPCVNAEPLEAMGGAVAVQSPCHASLESNRTTSVAQGCLAVSLTPSQRTSWVPWPPRQRTQDPRLRRRQSWGRRGRAARSSAPAWPPGVLGLSELVLTKGLVRGTGSRELGSAGTEARVWFAAPLLPPQARTSYPAAPCVPSAARDPPRRWAASPGADNFPPRPRRQCCPEGATPGLLLRITVWGHSGGGRVPHRRRPPPPHDSGRTETQLPR